MNINEIILFELHKQISNVNMAYFHDIDANHTTI